MNKTFIPRRIMSVLLALAVCAGLFAAVPQAALAADNNYTAQFNSYVTWASQNGLIPTSLRDNLDEVMSESDLLDFALQFSKMKCGTDVDALLKSARASSSTDERAKVSAINDMLDEKVWGISADGELSNKVNLFDSLSLFQYMGYKQLSPMSPLLYYANDDLPANRYNFQNVPMVAYHLDVMGGMMSEIVGLSQGLQGTTIGGDDTVTRRQFAAFCYMLSTMTLPKDPSGKYPGGMTMDKTTDDFVAAVLDSVIKPGMSDTEQIKAIYDYMVYNYRHDSTLLSFTFGSAVSANPLACSRFLASPLVETGKGPCDVFANLFRLFAIRLGFECNYVSGYYIRTDGTKNGHGWNQIKINDEWYWIDIDVENSVFYDNKRTQPSYSWFMKKDSEWVKNHAWAQADWPAADGTKHPVGLSAYGEPTPPSTPTPPPAPALTAKPTASAVLVNGENVAFDAYNINGNNYFKLRDLAYILSGTEKQFEVAWDGANNAISLTSGKPYTAVGGEMAAKGAGDKTPTATSSKIYLDGKEVTFTAYNIDGNNYFKLRDIGQAFDFGVAWDGAKNTIVIDTSIGYTPE